MIKTFSSRAGRLSDTNKKFLQLQSDSILKLGEKPKTTQKIVMDIGFGDAQSFICDVTDNPDYTFIGIEPYKKGFARAVQFYEENLPSNMYLFNGDAREFFQEIEYKTDYVRIHFPDPWPKKRHTKRRLITKNFLKTLHGILQNSGSVEIITDSSIYQKHIEELLAQEINFIQIENFPITHKASTFHKKAIKKDHTIKKYILEKVNQSIDP